MKKKENYYLYAYKISGNDTIDPMVKKADFLTQPGKNGEFTFSYL